MNSPILNSASDPPEVEPLLSASRHSTVHTPQSEDPPDDNRPQTPKSQKPERRSHSKIGRLPKTVRDQLNCLLRDGVPYQEIPAALGDQVTHITARNISSWHSSPHYQHWVLEKEWLENLRADQEPAF